VQLWLAIAFNRDWVPDADNMLASLRKVIIQQECQPDPVETEWHIPAH
jgi:hypothetical protein